MNPPIDEPAISLFVREHDEQGIEVRVNFGVFAGRHASPAEIDELAATLRQLVPAFAILAEERHEFADSIEAKVHQVVVEVPREDAVTSPTSWRVRSSKPRTAGRSSALPPGTAAASSRQPSARRVRHRHRRLDLLRPRLDRD